MSAYKKRVEKILNGKPWSQKEKINHLVYVLDQRIKSLKKASPRDWKKLKKRVVDWNLIKSNLISYCSQESCFFYKEKNHKETYLCDKCKYGVVVSQKLNLIIFLFKELKGLLFRTNWNHTSIYFINDHKDKLLRVSNHWGGGTFLPTKDFKKQDFINDLKTIKFMINLKK